MGGYLERCERTSALNHCSPRGLGVDGLTNRVFADIELCVGFRVFCRLPCACRSAPGGFEIISAVVDERGCSEPRLADEVTRGLPRKYLNAAVVLSEFDEPGLSLWGAGGFQNVQQQSSRLEWRPVCRPGLVPRR